MPAVPRVGWAEVPAAEEVRLLLTGIPLNCHSPILPRCPVCAARLALDTPAELDAFFASKLAAKLAYQAANGLQVCLGWRTSDIQSTRCPWPHMLDNKTYRPAAQGCRLSCATARLCLQVGEEHKLIVFLGRITHQKGCGEHTAWTAF